MTAPRLLQSAAVVGLGTGLSRLLGFVREMLMAYYFGTSLAKSAFDVAFRVPNLFRRLFGEGALSAAFIPVFTRTLLDEGQPEADRLAGRTLTALVTVLGMIVLGGVLLMTAWIRAGEQGARVAAVLPLLRIMFPYLLFICVAAFSMALLNSMHRFALPAMTPVVLNLVWILVLVFVCPRFGDSPETRIHAVAWGILAAGALQMGIQFPAIRALGFRLPASMGWSDARLRRIVILMGPTVLGMGIHQVNVFLDGLLALWAAPWAPAALTFAERLIYLPLGIFATAFGTVLLPAFSRQAAARSHAAMGDTLTRGLRAVLVLMLPASVGLVVLAGPVIALVYQWSGGAFDADSVRFTTRALVFYAPGLVVFSLYKLLVPVFYALEDTRTPVRIGVRVVGLNFALNLLAILTLPVGYRHAGMALATVVCSGINSLFLARVLSGSACSPDWRLVGSTAMRAGVATLLMAVTVLGVHRYVALGLASVPLKQQQALAVGVAIAVGIGAYTVLLLLLCRAEVRLLRRMR